VLPYSSPQAEDNDEEEEVVRVGSNNSEMHLTPFASLIAEKTVRDTNSQGGKGPTSNLSNRHHEALSVLREVMEGSPSVMGPSTYYAQTLIRAMARKADDDLKGIEEGIRQVSLVRQARQQNYSDDGKKRRKEMEKEEEQNAEEDNNDNTLTEVNLSSLIKEDTSWITAVIH